MVCSRFNLSLLIVTSYLFAGVPLVLLEMERLCLLNMQRYMADFTVERPLDYQLRTEEEGHLHYEFFFLNCESATPFQMRN